MNITGKKLFLFGFIALLLVGIPVTVFFVQQQQEIRSRAEKSTTLSFSPESSASNPIQKNVSDSVPLDIMVNPGTNLVSFVKVEIQYDPEKLATDSANAFQVNNAVFPSVLEGPIYTSGKIAVTLSVGPDPTKAIQTLSKAGTITFTAVSPTDAGTPTLVTYTTTTQALSIGSSDQASENVLSTTTPATIVIAGEATATNTPTPTTGESEPTAVPTATPTSQPTATPIAAATSTPVPTSGGGGGGGGTANTSPVCSSLTVDRETTGAAPFAITFTANGTDDDGTISKVTFNFGDGFVEDVTQSGGIGTGSVNAQMSHTYQNPGTYEATAILTDSNNAVSDSVNCHQTILVQSASGSAETTPQATIAPTGSTEVLFGIGAIATVLMIVGSLFFFVL